MEQSHLAEKLISFIARQMARRNDKEVNLPTLSLALSLSLFLNEIIIIMLQIIIIMMCLIVIMLQIIIMMFGMLISSDSARPLLAARCSLLAASQGKAQARYPALVSAVVRQLLLPLTPTPSPCSRSSINANSRAAACPPAAPSAKDDN